MKNVKALSDDELKSEQRSLWLEMVGLLALAVLPISFFVLNHVHYVSGFTFSWNIFLSASMMSFCGLLLYDIGPRHKRSVILRLVELSGESWRRKTDEHERKARTER